MDYLLVYLATLVPFVALAFAEAEIEGKHGGGGKNARFFNAGPLRVRRYNFYVCYVTIPLFILIPWVVGRFDLKLFYVLVSASFVGGLLLDFTWFLINPHYGFKGFNSKDAKWLVWWKLGKFEIPHFYITNSIMSLIFLLLFFLLK